MPRPLHASRTPMLRSSMRMMLPSETAGRPSVCRAKVLTTVPSRCKRRRQGALDLVGQRQHEEQHADGRSHLPAQRPTADEQGQSQQHRQQRQAIEPVEIVVARRPTAAPRRPRGPAAPTNSAALSSRGTTGGAPTTRPAPAPARRSRASSGNRAPSAATGRPTPASTPSPGPAARRPATRASRGRLASGPAVGELAVGRVMVCEPAPSVRVRSVLPRRSVVQGDVVA